MSTVPLATVPLPYPSTMDTMLTYYDPSVAYPQYAWNPMMPQFPPTPTSAPSHMYPDTTVKSGSEQGDTPPSGGSGNGPKKRKFKSPQEEERYRMKRDRNNIAAQKSRQERKKKEDEMQKRIRVLEDKCAAYERTIRQLQQERAETIANYGIPFNNENAPPQATAFADTKPFPGMYVGMNGLSL